MINAIFQIDIFIFRHIFGWNGRRILDRLFYWITRSGDGYLYGVIGFVLLYINTNQTKLAILAALAAFAIEIPWHAFTKRATKRIRPFEKLDGISSLIAPPDKYSFPSGHTAAAFLMATVIGFQFPFLKLPFFMWASAVGLSRIYLGVHYPTDVIVGVVIGVLSANFGIWIIS